jgi:hypothetical protein
MAQYAFRNHNGLWTAHVPSIRAGAYHLASKAAAGVDWNRLGSTPDGWATRFPTIKFNPATQMYEIPNKQQKWEGKALYGLYRLDLQSINQGWANWHIQENDTGHSVAVCLMEVESCFSQSQLVYALIGSAMNTQLCEMTAG